MAYHYKLDGREPVPVEDLVEWATWFETANRRVAWDELPGGVVVSTTFLGLDHRFFGSGPPLLFETMIFHGPHHDYQERYASWEEAELGHAEALALARGAMN